MQLLLRYVFGRMCNNVMGMQNSRKFVKEAQFFNKQQSVLPILCKDKSGNILSEHGDVLQRWKQYFCDLQNMNARFKELIPENIILNNVEEVPPPAYYEVSQVIKKLRTHKAAGSGNIPAELIKQGGIELERRIHNLIMNIWKEETVPTEWTEGIALLNAAYKIFTILINNRLSSIVESKLEDCQMGF